MKESVFKYSLLDCQVALAILYYSTTSEYGQIGGNIGLLRCQVAEVPLCVDSDTVGGPCVCGRLICIQAYQSVNLTCCGHHT